MANLKQSGTRISQYQTAQVNINEQKEKLLLNHFLISYAPAYYGIGTVNKNFKIPVQSLRDDFKGYIGLVNAKGDWRNSIRFWSGNWSDADRTNSYIYKWDTTLRGEYDYISNKFDVEQGIDKIFLLKTAPWPLEAEQADPAPESNKFVNKKYIDDRFNGIRKVTVSDTTLQIRPYPCVYEYSAMPSSINIVDTLTLEDGRTIKDCIEKNCLIFYIKLPTPTSTTLSVKANNVDTKWGFSGELTQLLSTAKKNADSGLIKCYAEYIDGTFTVHCTNGMNLKPGEGGTVEIDTTDTIVDGSDAVPTSNAVYEFTDITKYYFPDLDYEDRKDYIIYDATGNPIYISFVDDIVDGTKMFINSNFRKFTLTLPNLTNGNQMFMHNHYLQFVDSDFSKVTDGYRMFRATGSQMFDGDQTGVSSPYGNQLKHFRGSLKSLTNGNQMFEGCVLDVDSVCYIIDSLQNENIATTNASMTLGIDAQYKSNTTLLNKLNITEGTTSTSVKNKNGITWSLTLQWNTRKPMWKYLQEHSK